MVVVADGLVRLRGGEAYRIFDGVLIPHSRDRFSKLDISAAKRVPTPKNTRFVFRKTSRQNIFISSATHRFQRADTIFVALCRRYRLRALKVGPGSGFRHIRRPLRYIGTDSRCHHQA